MTASDSARLTGIRLSSVHPISLKLRQRIADFCEQQSPFVGAVEVNESCFDPQRGRGAKQKTLVFGLLQRHGQRFTEILPDARNATCLRASHRQALPAVIRGKVAPESMIHSDGWRGDHGLVDMGYVRHFRVAHGANAFANQPSHIHGMESFWASYHIEPNGG